MDVRNPPSPLIQYDKVTTIEKIGDFPLHLLSIRDLDKALNEICDRFDTKTPEEEDLLLDLCPYFGVIWPSARALATFLSERKTLVSKKKGIEVGCGLALPSLIAAKTGAEMLATDFHPDVEAWVKENAALNSLRVTYRKFSWTDASLSPEIQPHSYDFVLASDVLYEKRHPDQLVRALDRLVKPEGSIYLSDPGRAYIKHALIEFEDLGYQRSDFSFDVEESSSLPEHRLEKKRTVWVYEFRKS